ncbi:diguanylate cyclase [Alteromonas sp. RKMC-009]|nr:diguanylate cyclase [Alteromonas sp. RKMC-009]
MLPRRMIKFNTLRTQLMLGILLACLTILSAQAFIRYYYILPAFETMAQEGDRQDLERVASQVRQELESLHNLVYDSAVWDAMYNAAMHRDSDWFEENYLIPESYRRIHINGWYLYDRSGELISGRSYRDDGTELVPENLSSSTKLNLNSAGNEAPAQPSAHTLFTRIAGNPAVAIFHPVLPSDENGEPAGTLVLWRFIDQQFVDSLTPGMAGDIIFHSQKALPDNPEAFSLNFASGSPVHAQPFKGRLYLVINSLQNTPLFALSIQPRPRQYDNSLFDASLIAGILITLTVIAVFYLWVNRQLIAPIASIHDNVSFAMRSRDFSRQTPYRGRNEAFRLGRKLNEMFALINHQRNEVLQHNKQLEKISNTDPLTGLANRRHLDSYFRNLPLPVRAGGGNIAVILADVDYFKRYNDHYGHAGGDKVLKQVAALLRKNTRTGTDIVVRYGGEEFLIVLQQTSAQGAVKVAETLLNGIRLANIPHESRDDSKHIVTVSAGIAWQREGEPLLPEKLLKKADDALYRAKSSGRDCFITEGQTEAPLRAGGA